MRPRPLKRPAGPARALGSGGSVVRTGGQPRDRGGVGAGVGLPPAPRGPSGTDPADWPGPWETDLTQSRRCPTSGCPGHPEGLCLFHFKERESARGCVLVGDSEPGAGRGILSQGLRSENWQRHLILSCDSADTPQTSPFSAVRPCASERPPGAAALRPPDTAFTGHFADDPGVSGPAAGPLLA